MGRIDAIIDDDVIKKFRLEIVKRKGGKKGDFSIALKEAMNLWIIQKKENNKDKSSDIST
jgi:hypothetical protein